MNDFFDKQAHLPVEGVVEHPFFRVYQLADTKQVVCEVKLDLGLGETVELAQITDVHINYCDSVDESDDELMFTKLCRKWMANAEAIPALDRCMDAAAHCDLTLLTGDILDYQSHGTRELLVQHVFKRDPGVLCVPAIHDYSRNVETNRPDRLPFYEREQFLRVVWNGDLHYQSRVLKNKLKAILMDNGIVEKGHAHFYPSSADQLRYDLDCARKAGQKVLLFMHEPLTTKTESDIGVKSLWPLYHPDHDFVHCNIIGNDDFANDVDREVYELIRSNGDLIGGLFCGHYHSVFCVNIPAEYTDENGTHKTAIPQFVSPGANYCDLVGVLTRIIAY